VTDTVPNWVTQLGIYTQAMGWLGTVTYGRLAAARGAGALVCCPCHGSARVYDEIKAAVRTVCLGA
jgi:hypothetical protein